MNESGTTALQVYISDATCAADMFSVLMGNIAAPRRNFTQAHALEVRNLDI